LEEKLDSSSKSIKESLLTWESLKTENDAFQLFNKQLEDQLDALAKDFSAKQGAFQKELLEKEEELKKMLELADKLKSESKHKDEDWFAKFEQEKKNFQKEIEEKQKNTRFKPNKRS